MSRRLPRGFTIIRHRGAPSRPDPEPVRTEKKDLAVEERAEAYENLSERLLKAEKAEKRNSSGQTITRFSSNQFDQPSKYQKRGHDTRKYSVNELRQAIQLAFEYGTKEAAKQTGIPYQTVFSCWRNRMLPKTGPFRFEQMMKLVLLAERKYRDSDRMLSPMTCVRAACREMKLPNVRLRRFLSWELIPAVPGLPMYADPDVQLRCEKYAREWPKMKTACEIFPK